VGAQRRVGVTAAYVTDKITATFGVFGSGEAVQRNALTPDEGYGFNGRIVYEPINDTNRLVHVGASAFKAFSIGGNALTLGDRPGFREDGGLLVSLALPGTATFGSPETGVKNATYWGLEAAGVYGPFSVQGEYNKLHVDQYGAAPSGNFDGYYVFGSFFATGESRTFKSGVVDRVKPFNDFNPAAGKWGAIELLARYDVLDLTDHDISPLDRKGHTWTGAINWYLNPNLRVFLNYIRFQGQNSPLVRTPATRFGTMAKGDALATRLQVDF
jgi:phosphate-selective porin OprO/OprP